MSELALTNGHGPHSGDDCPRDSCEGSLVAYCSRAIEAEGVRVKYLHCNACGCRPLNNLQIVPLRYAPQRKNKNA